VDDTTQSPFHVGPLFSFLSRRASSPSRYFKGASAVRSHLTLGRYTSAHAIIGR